MSILSETLYNGAFMNHTIAALSLIIFVCNSNAMEKPFFQRGTSLDNIDIRIVSLEENPGDGEILNLPVDNNGQKVLPLFVAIDAYKNGPNESNKNRLRKLMRLGANPNKKNNANTTALEYARSHELTDVIEILENKQFLLRE